MQEAARKVKETGYNGNVVFLVDSQAAILGLTSNNLTECPETIACRASLAELNSSQRQVTIQWIPSHVGIPGNERADILAKQGTTLPQPNALATLTSAYARIASTVKRATSRDHQAAAAGKCWESLYKNGPIPGGYSREVAVCLFRTITGHDYLQAHLHRLNLAPSDTCPLCNGGRMDANHLWGCNALSDVPAARNRKLELSSLYWSARRRMAELPRAGVG